jgi:hypothetical protein
MSFQSALAKYGVISSIATGNERTENRQAERSGIHPHDTRPLMGQFGLRQSVAMNFRRLRGLKINSI